ncbi:hypothetical protein BurJ1DRAFT_0008 [Burkholderiales bacterium JOSHI_001]|nr:hypothetical protein BurJ1DRAFT_0008 [Burkholderiales bacterium JOSHI_001]
MTSLIRSALAQAMRSGISTALGSSAGAKDDLIGAAALKLNNQAGDQAVVTLVGDGGRYNVRYAAA